MVITSTFHNYVPLNSKMIQLILTIDNLSTIQTAAAAESGKHMAAGHNTLCIHPISVWLHNAVSVIYSSICGDQPGRLNRSWTALPAYKTQ